MNISFEVRTNTLQMLSELDKYFADDIDTTICNAIDTYYSCCLEQLERKKTLCTHNLMLSIGQIKDQDLAQKILDNLSDETITTLWGWRDWPDLDLLQDTIQYDVPVCQF